MRYLIGLIVSYRAKRERARRVESRLSFFYGLPYR
jgi:hypothetical protein